MIVTNPYKYGCCHDAVVVVSLYCSHLLAVVLIFVEVKFIGGLKASFNVKSVAKGFDKEVYHHWLGGAVGVESPTARTALLYFLQGCTAIKVAVFARNLVKDVFKVVSFGAFGLQGVGFNDKQGIVVGPCYLHGFPGEFVVFYMSMPACDNFGYSAIGHGYAVGNKYARVVGLVACAAYIDCHYVPVAQVWLFLGHEPYAELVGAFVFAGLAWNELAAAVVLCNDVTHKKRGDAASPCLVDICATEDAAACALEGFGSCGWELGKEPPLIG